jgi:hypothetical protein
VAQPLPWPISASPPAPLSSPLSPPPAHSRQLSPRGPTRIVRPSSRSPPRASLPPLVSPRACGPAFSPRQPSSRQPLGPTRASRSAQPCVPTQAARPGARSAHVTAHAARGAPPLPSRVRASESQRALFFFPKRFCAFLSPTTSPKLNYPRFLRSFSPTNASPRLAPALCVPCAVGVPPSSPCARSPHSLRSESRHRAAVETMSRCGRRRARRRGELTLFLSLPHSPPLDVLLARHG